MEMLQTEAQRRKSSEGGFTLVELLVVIVIIGILAAVAVFAVGGIVDNGEESACDADRRAVETAVEAFKAQSDSPSTVTVTEADIEPEFIRDISLYTVGSGNAVVPTAAGTAANCT